MDVIIVVGAVVALFFAWIRVRAIGVIAGTLTLAAMVSGTGVGTLALVRNMLRTDRLVAEARRSECVLPGAVVWLPAMTESHPGVWAAQMAPEAATQVGLPVRGRRPWRVTLRTHASRHRHDMIGTYALGDGEVSSTSDGDVGHEEVVFLALRYEAVEALLPVTRLLGADTVIAHETVSLAWFRVLEDALVIYDDANGGTLEVRELDLTLRARATGVGALDRPVESLLRASDGSVFVALAGVPPVVGRVTTDGQWSRTEVPDVALVAGLSEARAGGACVWSAGSNGAVFHVDGTPLAVRAWPIGVVLGDRIVLEVALLMSWLVTLTVLAWIVRRARPWLALRRGVVRVGEVHGKGSVWSESGEEHHLDTRAWLGFSPAVPVRPEPAVAIETAVGRGTDAYRASARRELRARWIVRGTRDQARAFLAARLRSGLSAVGIAGLLVVVIAMLVVAIARTL